MRRDWTEDGHKLLLYLTPKDGLQLEVVCPHGDQPPEGAPCAAWRESPTKPWRCIVTLEAKELGVGEILWDCMEHDHMVDEDTRMNVEGAVEIDWKGHWWEDDVEFWWRVHGMGAAA